MRAPTLPLQHVDERQHVLVGGRQRIHPAASEVGLVAGQVAAVGSQRVRGTAPLDSEPQHEVLDRRVPPSLRGDEIGIDVVGGAHLPIFPYRPSRRAAARMPIWVFESVIRPSLAAAIASSSGHRSIVM